MPSIAAKIERLCSFEEARPRRMPWLIATAGILVSTLGFVHLHQRVTEEAEIRLAREATHLTADIQDGLDSVLKSLVATAALVDRSPSIALGELQRLAQEVFRSDRAVVTVARLRAHGSGYGTELLFGPDMAPIRPDLSSAMQDAEATKSGLAIGISAGTTGQSEPLIAIIKRLKTESAGGDLLVAALQPSRLAAIDPAASESGILGLELMPSPAVGNPAVVAVTVTANGTASHATAELVRSFQFAGRDWQARFLAIPGGGATLGFSPLLMLLGGLSLTMAIAGHLLSNQRRAKEIGNLIDRLRRTNAQLTERVRERDQMSDTLRASDWKYREVIDGVSDVIFECDADGRLSLLNAAWAQITGLPVSTSMTASLFDFVPENDQQTLRSYFLSLTDANPSPKVAELHLRVQGGGTRLVEIAARRLATPHGGTGQIVGLIKDITERRQAETALQDAEQRYRAIVENALDGIFQSTPAGRFLSANHALAKMLGYAGPDDLISSIQDLGQQLYADPDRRAQFMAEVGAGAATGHELEFLRKDGTAIWVAVSARAVRDESGAVSRYEGTIKEITERKHAETALRLAKEQADMASRTKSEFLANMSHELRTPLNAIIGFSEIIKDQMFGPINRPDYAEYARDIFDSGKHLLELINDILDMSKIEAGKRELNETTIDLNRVVMACLRLIRPRAEAASLKIGTDIASGSNYLRAEELALKQVLLNLLSNAVKFTPEGGEVSLRAKIEEDGAILITVSDTGIGIAKQDIAKALSPFGQIDSALSRRTSGTGLGLTLVQSLVALHGGRFHLQSELGTGTTAYVWLPANRVLREVA